jgi:hypothetical protein
MIHPCYIVNRSRFDGINEDHPRNDIMDFPRCPDLLRLTA